MFRSVEESDYYDQRRVHWINQGFDLMAAHSMAVADCAYKLGSNLMAQREMQKDHEEGEDERYA